MDKAGEKDDERNEDSTKNAGGGVGSNTVEKPGQLEKMEGGEERAGLEEGGGAHAAGSEAKPWRNLPVGTVRMPSGATISGCSVCPCCDKVNRGDTCSRCEERWREQQKEIEAGIARGVEAALTEVRHSDRAFETPAAWDNSIDVARAVACPSPGAGRGSVRPVDYGAETERLVASQNRYRSISRAAAQLGETPHDSDRTTEDAAAGHAWNRVPDGPVVAFDHGTGAAGRSKDARSDDDPDAPWDPVLDLLGGVECGTCNAPVGMRCWLVAVHYARVRAAIDVLRRLGRDGDIRRIRHAGAAVEAAVRRQVDALYAHHPSPPPDLLSGPDLGDAALPSVVGAAKEAAQTIANLRDAIDWAPDPLLPPPERRFDTVDMFPAQRALYERQERLRAFHVGRRPAYSGIGAEARDRYLARVASGDMSPVTATADEMEEAGAGLLAMVDEAMADPDFVNYPGRDRLLAAAEVVRTRLAQLKGRSS